MYLIIEVFHQFFMEVASVNVSRVIVGAGVAAILTLLCFVRKIEVFAPTHKIALTFIFITIIVSCTFGGL